MATLEKALSSVAVESYAIDVKVGSHKVCALVNYKPSQDNLSENIVELYMGLDSLAAPMQFIVCGVNKLKTAVQREEFACNIVDSYAAVFIPSLIRWKDCIDSLEKTEVRKAMKLDEYTDYISDAAFDMLKTKYPKMKFGGMLGRFER